MPPRSYRCIHRLRSGSARRIGFFAVEDHVEEYLGDVRVVINDLLALSRALIDEDLALDRKIDRTRLAIRDLVAIRVRGGSFFCEKHGIGGQSPEFPRRLDGVDFGKLGERNVAVGAGDLGCGNSAIPFRIPFCALFSDMAPLIRASSV